MPTMLIREAAKVVASRCNVTLGEQKAFAILRYTHVLIGKTNEPYQQYMQYFDCKNVAYEAKEGIKYRLHTEIYIPNGVDFLERVVRRLQTKGELDTAMDYLRKNKRRNI